MILGYDYDYIITEHLPLVFSSRSLYNDTLSAFEINSLVIIKLK